MEKETIEAKKENEQENQKRVVKRKEWKIGVKSRRIWRTIIRKIKQFRVPFLFFILFWIAGIITIYVLEIENRTIGHIFLVSICARACECESAFIQFYQLFWPVVFELVIIIFILTTLQDMYGYNPIIAARKIAKHQKNHTVVLGYNHLGERIVDYLREEKKPYALVDIETNKVEDLINFDQPVVVGDYTDEQILELAGVRKCKEVFCVTKDLRKALIAAEVIREMNDECSLYMRVFDEHFREYLAGEPWHAYTFSTSKWTMESVKKWSEGITEETKIILLGNDTIVRRIAQYYGEELKSKVYWFDPEIEPTVYVDLPNVIPYKEDVKFIENLEEKVELEKIEQIYLCWNTNEKFSDAIILTVALKKQYPEIKLYVRMFDEELAKIAKAVGVTTFSTSAYAFKMLQKEVNWYSGIAPKNEEE
jgi:Trk K+ transport system NAD-binding subunit